MNDNIQVWIRKLSLAVPRDFVTHAKQSSCSHSCKGGNNESRPRGDSLRMKRERAMGAA